MAKTFMVHLTFTIGENSEFETEKQIKENIVKNGHFFAESDVNDLGESITDLTVLGSEMDVYVTEIE